MICFPGVGKYSNIYAFTVKPLGISTVKKCLDEFHTLLHEANLLRSCNEFNLYRFVYVVYKMVFGTDVLSWKGSQVKINI
jgi:hypothetical protein